MSVTNDRFVIFLPSRMHPYAVVVAMLVVSVLHSQSPEAFRDRSPGFRQDLKDAGYVESENVAIEYRWKQCNLYQTTVIDRFVTLSGIGRCFSTT